MKLTKKEKIILNGLLNIAGSGWYSTESLPAGIKSVTEAEKIVTKLNNKINESL